MNEGIKRIRQKNCSKGILAILELTKRPIETLQASDLGFTVAPRINAAGRLDTAILAADFLISDSKEAIVSFKEIEKNNEHRKSLDEQTTLQAITSSLFDMLGASMEVLFRILCVFLFLFSCQSMRAESMPERWNMC